MRLYTFRKKLAHTFRSLQNRGGALNPTFTQIISSNHRVKHIFENVLGTKARILLPGTELFEKYTKSPHNDHFPVYNSSLL